MKEVLKIIDPDAPVDLNPNPNLQNVNPERLLMMQKQTKSNVSSTKIKEDKSN